MSLSGVRAGNGTAAGATVPEIYICTDETGSRHGAYIDWRASSLRHPMPRSTDPIRVLLNALAWCRQALASAAKRVSRVLSRGGRRG